MENDKSEDEFFAEYKGSIHGFRDLPWQDVEQTIFIIINKIPGDDLGIALDYRLDSDNPRVIGGDWQAENRIEYKEVSPTFEAFVHLLGI